MSRFLVLTLILIASLVLSGAIPTMSTLSTSLPPSQDLSYIESSAGLTPPELEAGHTELEMGDVNRDGNPDLVSIGDHYGGIYEQQGIMVWFGDGAGHWSWHHYGQDFGYGGIALGDVNNDGLVDVGYGMHHNYDGELGDQLIEVALGDGTGLAWTPWDDGLASNGEDWGMFGTDFADVDHDGDLDLGSMSFGCCNGAHIYLNQADGSWQQSWASSTGNGDNQFTFGDVNGDATPDLAINFQYGTVFLGDGTGGFSNGSGNLPAYPPSVSLGDVNNDGRDELAITNNSGGVQVWAWLSPGTWQNISAALPSSGPYEAVQLFDMNMDGFADVVAFGNGQLRIWAGDESGTWSEIASFTTPSPGYESAFRVGADVDHNGFPDIVLVASEGNWPSDQNHMHFYREASSPTSLLITPLTPSQQKSYHAGAVIFIDWISAVPQPEIATVTLELSTHGPQGPWDLIAADLPNNGRFQWRIPPTTPSTNDAYIRFTLTTSLESASAITPAAFNILGITEEPISGLAAYNDGPTILNETTILSATVISGTNLLYNWDLGDGLIATGSIITHTYPEIGLYTATVTATNSVSVAQTTTLVEVFEQPISGLTASNSSPTFLGESTTLTATIETGSNVNFVWALGDGITMTGDIVDYAYPGLGFYTATVTASNALGSAQQLTQVEIIKAPPAWRICLPILWRSGN